MAATKPKMLIFNENFNQTSVSPITKTMIQLNGYPYKSTVIEEIWISEHIGLTPPGVECLLWCPPEMDVYRLVDKTLS